MGGKKEKEKKKTENQHKMLNGVPQIRHRILPDDFRARTQLNVDQKVIRYDLEGRRHASSKQVADMK